MTNDQWKLFEESLHLAPEITREMYASRPDLTQAELIDMTRSIYAGCANLQQVQNGYKFKNMEEQQEFCECHFMLVAGLYGRLMGLAKAYDAAITKQAVLEAELATTGK